ncbi:MAG: glycosyltransferase family 39 protein [Microgenomates group bacterium]
MKKSLILLGLIFITGLFLRIVVLGSTPSGFTPDEASQGYAAYSLLQTGKDEWGIPWPLTSFRAFADYRAPLQTYLMIPSVAVFGLNEFAVRLPSAIFGSLAILLLYFLAKALFPKQPKVALFASLFLAISPWHLQFSRMALEANYSSFFLTGGLLFFILGLTKPRLFILSAILFGLDLYSYLAAKIFVPLFILGLLLVYRDSFQKIAIKYLCLFLGLLALFGAPLYLDSFFGPGNVRGKDLIITNFSKENINEIGTIQYLSPLNKINPQISRLFTNKLTFTITHFYQNYLSYLSPAFWFAESGWETTYAIIPGRGLLYFWMIPLLFYGIYFLIKRKDKTSLIFLLWLLLGIIPAAITKEGYRPNRAGSLMTLFELVSAFGFVELLQNFRFLNRALGKIIIGFIVLISFAFYLNDYFIVWKIKYPDAMSYGYRELVAKVNQYQKDYNKVVIDRGSQSQVFFAFYSKMNPAEYQTYSEKWWPIIQERNLLFLDMIDSYTLKNFTFRSFDASVDLVPGNLVVIPAVKMTEILKPNIVDRVNYPDYKPAFYLLHYVQK